MPEFPSAGRWPLIRPLREIRKGVAQAFRRTVKLSSAAAALALSHVRAAIRRVRYGHVAARLGHRIIVLSTMSMHLKVALGVAYAVLFALAIMTAGHRLVETAANFDFTGVGLTIPLGVFIAGVPIWVLIASFVMSSAILANRTARWGSIVLLAFYLYFLGTRAGPPLLAVQLQLPIVFFVVIAILYRRLPRWTVLLGSLLAFGALIAIVWRLNSTSRGDIAGVVATLILGSFLIFLVPALFVVGMDIAEWAEILGETTTETFPPIPERREWILAGLAVAANLGVVAYWFTRPHAFAWGEVGSREVPSLGQIALAIAVLAVGLSAIMAALLRFPAHSRHASHFGYVAILALGYLVVGAPIFVGQYAEQDAPPPTLIFKHSYANFSIDPAPGWEAVRREDKSDSTVVILTRPHSLGEFGVFFFRIIDDVATLNEIIPGGETFPRTVLTLSPPDQGGWMRFDTVLTRYENVRRGWLGVELQTVTADFARSTGLAKVGGVRVTAVRPDGPAASGGLRKDDIILALNGEAVKSDLDLTSKTGSMTSGSPVIVTIWRGAEQLDLTVKLGELPQELKPQFHFVVWRKSIPFYPGRVDPRRDAQYLMLGICEAKPLPNDCMTAVEAMHKSWSPDIRTVPSPWGEIAVRWVWLLIAAIALSLIPWRRRRSDARGLVALSTIALVMFALEVSGMRTYKDLESYFTFIVAEHRWSFLIVMLGGVMGSTALMVSLAVTRRRDRHDSDLLRLTMALNFSLLLLYGAFEGLASTLGSAEKSSIVRGLLVLAALTWEITASGSFTNIATRHMPRASRLLLFLGYILLVAVMVFMSFPARVPDIAARLVGGAFSSRLHQQFVVENRPGAGTSIAAEDVVRAPADGYTILLVAAANTINTALYPNLDFNFIRDITPVAAIGGVVFVMAVNPSVPAKTVPDLIAYAKANPGKVNFASRGIGSLTHVFGELFKMMAGVDLVHVPYRGDYTADLLAGRVQLAFFAIADAAGYLAEGKMLALAVTTKKRFPGLPGVPAMDEFLPGYEATGWLGVGAPSATAVAIVDKLNAETNAVLADPPIRTRLLDMGIEPMSMTAAAFSKFIAAETSKWAGVVKFAGIKRQ